MPADYVGIPLIIEAATMLGKEFRIRVKRHDNRWLERPCLWGVSIGRPSRKKSPAAEEALKTIHMMRSDMQREYSAARADWEHQKKDGKDPGEPPKLESLLVNDATVEALVNVLSDERNADSRGVLFYRDELSAWFTGLNQYRGGTGNDRPFFLQCWSGGSHRVDRKTSGVITVDDLYLNIYGSIQPGIVTEVFRNGDMDGMTARFQLMAFPVELPEIKLVDRQPDSEARSAVHRRLRTMRSVKAPRDFDCPDLPGEPFHYSDKAQELFDEWRIKTENRKEDDPGFDAHVGKYPSLFARLSLVFHFMRFGEMAPELDVDVATATAVRSFIDDYLELHARKVYGLLAEHPARRGATRILKWIQESEPQVSSFTVRDIVRRHWIEFKGERDRESIEASLRQLEADGIVVLDHKRVGGEWSASARVNPRVFRR